MKKFGLSILPALLLGTAIAWTAPALASSVTVSNGVYDVNVSAGDATATGFFSGIIGNSSADVGAPLNLTLTEGLTSATLLGSSLGNTAEVAAGNSDAITVTADNVFFNFSDPNQDFLKFYSSSNNGTFLCFQTFAFCGGTGAGIVIVVAGAVDPFQSMTGNQVIASVASVPEPSTWAMLLLGFAGVGFMEIGRAHV